MINHGLRAAIITGLVAPALSLISSSAHALDFGIFDARSLAMGGASVAAGEGQQAHFSNPALLSQYEGEEEDTLNGRAYFPSAVVRASRDVEDTIDVLDLELDDQVNQAVDAFNADASPANAQLVADSTQLLLDELSNLGSQDLNGDAFIGLSVSEPSNRQGGSFYVGVRAIGDGDTLISQTDLDLLQSYVDTTTFLATGGAQGELNPALLNANGELIAPSENIVSSATISSLVSAEVGIAFSREFNIGDQYFSFGVTPKLMRVEVFSDVLNFSDADFDFSEDRREEITTNIDVGALWAINDNFRLAFSVKDLIPKTFDAANDLSVETKARARVGAAYLNRYITVGADFDLQTNSTLSGDPANQDAAIGIELRPLSWVQLRAGYRADVQSVREDVISVGVGVRLWRFVADLAYAQSSDERSAGLQLGWVF